MLAMKGLNNFETALKVIKSCIFSWIWGNHFLGKHFCWAICL